MPTERLRTIRPSGGDYTTLSGWESGEQADLTSTDEIRIGEIQGDWSGGADTTAVISSGWVMDGTRYSVLRADSANAAGAVWSSAKYILSISNATALELRTGFERIEKIQIERTSASADHQSGVLISTASAGTSYITEVVVKMPGSTYKEQAFRKTSGGTTILYVINSIAYNVGTSTGYGAGAFTSGAATAYFYNCVSISSGIGINKVGGTLVATNCYSSGASGSSYVGSPTLTTCASSDTTGSSGLQSIAYSTDNFVNVTGGSEDFHIPLTSALYDVGTDLSGTFTDDIDGDTRTAWSIGADDGTASGSTEQIAGVITGSSTATATLSGIGGLGAAAAGTSDIAGTIKATAQLAGIGTGVAGNSATLSGTGALSGVATDGLGTAAGIIRGTLNLNWRDPRGGQGEEGASDGTSTATGSIRAFGALSGASAGVATVSATFYIVAEKGLSLHGTITSWRDGGSTISLRDVGSIASDRFAGVIAKA